MAAEQTTIADLLVGLGVKADPNALAMLERFDKLLSGATSAVKSFSKVANAGASSIAALGASGGSLSPLIDQLDALIKRMGDVDASKLPTAAPGGSGGGKGGGGKTDAEKEADALAKAAKEAAKVAAEVEKARAKLEAFGASANAVEKITLDFKRQREEVARLLLVTGDQAAAEKALTAINEKEAAALKKLADATDKAADKAAKLAEAERKAAEEQKAANSLFGANNIEAFTGAMGFAVEVVEKLAEVAAYAVVSVAALGTALAANSLNVATDALQLERQAQAVGLSVEKYQELRYVLERFGVDSKDMADLFGQFSQQIVAAADGSKTVVALFDKLGLSAEDLLKMAPDEQLAALADAMASIENPTERLAIASTLLGEDLAKKLTPLLIQGGDAMLDMGKQANDLGLVLSQETVEASRKLTSEWAVLTGMAEGLRVKLGAALIPVLSDLADRLIKWYDANKDVVDQKMADAITDISDAFDSLGMAAGKVNDIFGGAGGFFAFVDKLVVATGYVWALGVAIGAIAAGPVLYLEAGFALFLLTLQDFYTYITGGTSVIGTLIDQFGETDTLLGAVIRTFQALGNVGSAAFNLLSIAFGAAWQQLQPFRDGLSSIASIAGGVVVSALSAIADGLTTILNLLTPVINGLATVMGSEGATTGAQALGGAAGGIAGGGVIGATVAGSAALAGTLAPSTTSSGRTTNATITIGGTVVNGSGLSAEQLTSVLADHSATQGRHVQAALAGTAI